MPTWFAISIFTLLIYLGFVFWAQVRFGSYRFALAYIQGARLEVRPAVKPVGTHRPGDVYQMAIRLSNHGSRPATVLGGLSDCSCVAYRGLPATIPPGGTVALPLTVRFANTGGDWRQSITYLTDDSRQPTLRAELSGRVVAFQKPQQTRKP